MNVLERFEFSQSSLQDFADCRRRFELRYLRRLAWPAVQAEPVRENEAHMRRGERFHKLAQQYLLGVPPERLMRMAQADEDENLRRWWQNFCGAIPPQLIGQRYVEVTLAASLNGFRLLAKYDLVLAAPNGCFTIYDWKTSIRRPKSLALLERLQTRVYPYLLVQAGAVLNHGCPLEPEQVQMVYWFADPDQPPEHIAYNRERWQEDQGYLMGLVSTIQALGGQSFELCADESGCRYCVYRSLCNRGIQAGDATLLEDDLMELTPESLDFDLEQIGEINF